MPEPDVVDQFLDGKISAWTLVRRLMKAGVTVAVAVAFTALLPAAAHSGDMAAIERLVAGVKKKDAREAKVLEHLTARLASSLIRLDRSGREAPLGRSLRRLSLNLANTGNEFAGIDFNGRVGNVNVVLDGNVIAAPNTNDPAANEANTFNENNYAVQISGRVGRLPLNLNGFVNVNVGGVPGPRGVELNVNGNLGQLPINLNDGNTGPR